MKKVKNYMDPNLANRKVARYQYWSIKDENGITICSSDENNPDNKNFAEVLDKIMVDKVDVEVQIKYGASEQSSRHNPPFFIQINQDIEWIDPEEDDTVTINGIPHKVDKQGNVNINLTQKEKEVPVVQTATIDTFRQEMDIQLSGLKKEYELKEEKWQLDLHNKLLEQTLKFKEMMLAEREAKIAEKEQGLADKEAKMNEKQQEIQENLKGYFKQIPSALSGLIGEFIKAGAKKTTSDLGEITKASKMPKTPPPRPKRKVKFTMEEPEEEFLEEEPMEEPEEFLALEEEKEEILTAENPTSDEEIQDQLGD